MHVHIAAVMEWLLICALVPTAAHKFPDGYVERTIAVVVRDRRVLVEYSVGMNDNTMKQVVDQWRNVQSLPLTKAKTNSLSTSKRRPVVADSAPSESTPEPRQDGVKKSATSSPVQRQEQSPDEPEEFEKNDAKILQEFQELAGRKLAQDLTVICQQQSFNLTDSWQPLPARRHMSLTLQFEYSLPDENVVNMKLVDKNFQEFVGGIRTALKSTGNSILTNSNVAPIVIRAERVELGGLSEENRIEACSIIAQIVQPKKKKQPN